MAFGAETTTDEVLQGVDLTGKFVVVTGGSAGLGLETCRALASAGAEVLLSARSDGKGAEAVAKIGEAVPAAKVSYALLLLDDTASIRRFAAGVLADHRRIDILINNAGIMATPLTRTKDGFESQFGTNHLGHFLLTSLLAPALLSAAPSRVVSLASSGHHMSDIDLDDPNYERRPYDKRQSYGQSKTANILFALELDRRMSGQGVNAYAVHPGAIRTELSRHFTEEDRAALNRRLADAGQELTYKSVPAGAASSVWAATAPELAGHGGVYIEDCHVADEGVAGSFKGQAPWARDAGRARRLWDISERLVGHTMVGA